MADAPTNNQIHIFLGTRLLAERNVSECAQETDAVGYIEIKYLSGNEVAGGEGGIRTLEGE